MGGPDTTAQSASSKNPSASFPTLPLAWKLTALVVTVVVFAGLVAGYFASQTLSDEISDLVGDRLLGQARMMAETPEVKDAFRTEHPEVALQPLLKLWMAQSGVDLIVVFNMDGIRYAHPNEDLIGLKFTGGDEGPSLHGESYVSRAVGVSGPSLRAFVPIYDEQRKQMGVIVVGTWIAHLNDDVNGMLLDTATVSLLGLVVGIIGAALVAYNIKASILGLEPFEIRGVLEERVAILESVREGIIAVEKDSKVTLLNRAAQELIGVGEEVVGKPVTAVLPNSRLPEVVGTGRPEFDQEQLLKGRVILTNRLPIKVEGKVVGAVATFRDMSEMRELAAELTGVREMAETLRAQAHEFVNRMHTVSGLIQLGRQEEALQYISTVTRGHEKILDFVTQRIHEPALAGLLLGKISAANERGITLTLDPDSYMPARDPVWSGIDLVTVVGNLIENALDAVAGLGEERRSVWVSVFCGESALLIEVEDTGTGISAADRPRVFERGFTTKEGGKGIGLPLVLAEVRKAGGKIDIESRPGTGTRFVVHLPKGTEEQVASVPPERPRSSRKTGAKVHQGRV